MPRSSCHAGVPLLCVDVAAHIRGAEHGRWWRPRSGLSLTLPGVEGQLQFSEEPHLTTVCALPQRKKPLQPFPAHTLVAVQSKDCPSMHGGRPRC